MPKPTRKLAFIVAATDHGTFIVNRFDQMMVSGDAGYGVGLQLLESAHYDPEEVNLLLRALDLRRQCYGDGVVAIDCGANVGVHTIEWAKHMTAWGAVLAIEAQERIYYALAGNIAINNCFNARAIHAAVAERAGTMKIPRQTSIDAIAGALGPICQPTRHRLPGYKQHDKSMLSKECPSDHNCTFLRMLTPTEMNNPPAHRCQTLVMTLGI